MNDAPSHYLVMPEVPGHLDHAMDIDHRAVPHAIASLRLVFDDWLGDSIVEVFPAFLVTEKLARALQSANLTGFEFADAEVSWSDQAVLLGISRPLPRFRWLRVSGRAHQADVGVDDAARLYVSSAALAVLTEAGMTYAEVEQT
jgi:hypothetical protein